MLNASSGHVEAVGLAPCRDGRSDRLPVRWVLVHEAAAIRVDVFLHVLMRLVLLQSRGDILEAVAHGGVELFVACLHNDADVVHLQVEQSGEGKSHHYGKHPNRRLLHCLGLY